VVEALIGIFKLEIRSLAQRVRSGHVVVCGVGRKANALIRDYRSERVKLVAIDPDPENALLQGCESAGVFVIHGDASCRWVLAKARVRQASHVFVTTGDDSTNVEIASHLINFVRAANKGDPRPANRPVCHLHLVDRQTAELFKQHKVFKEASEHVDIRIFNTFDNAARLLWRERLLNRCPINPGDTRRMHVVIGGLGQMGEAILLRVARSGHFANGRKVAVTIVDREASACRDRLFEQYRMLPHLCEIGCLDAELDSPVTLSRIAGILAGPDQIGTAVLCLDHDYTNFAIALRLAQHLGPDGAQVYVRLSEASGLSELLEAEHSEATLARQIDGFGLVRTCCTKDAILSGDIDAFARAFHASYVSEQLKAGKLATDAALQPWDKLGEVFQESNCEQAEHIEVKLRTFGYTRDKEHPHLPQAFDESQVETLGRMEHARWCAERWLAGWTYAPGKKNIALRTSPHLVPWEQLDDTIKKIDFDFVRAMPRILAL
jgi:voltage-gated potassium channel Kch